MSMKSREEIDNAVRQFVRALPKEVLDYFINCGIVVDSSDGSKYLNHDRWLRIDPAGIVTQVAFPVLPDDVKSVHLDNINGWSNKPNPMIRYFRVVEEGGYRLVSVSIDKMDWFYSSLKGNYRYQELGERDYYAFKTSAFIKEKFGPEFITKHKADVLMWKVHDTMVQGKDPFDVIKILLEDHFILARKTMDLIKYFGQPILSAEHPLHPDYKTNS